MTDSTVHDRGRSHVPAAMVATVGIALMVLAATMAPARAESVDLSDPADATASLTDIRSVEAEHGATDVAVRVDFEDLRRTSQASLSVFFDTDPDRRGPEYVLGSGLGDGTDYILATTRGWRRPHSIVECTYRARPRWRADYFRTRISRECLGEPERLRVSVRMVDTYDGSHPISDWAPGTRRWSANLASD